MTDSPGKGSRPSVSWSVLDGRTENEIELAGRLTGLRFRVGGVLAFAFACWLAARFRNSDSPMPYVAIGLMYWGSGMIGNSFAPRRYLALMNVWRKHWTAADREYADRVYGRLKYLKYGVQVALMSPAAALLLLRK